MWMLNTLRFLCFDKCAELIKSLKTHTPQQSVSRSTPVLPITHNVTVSLSRDNASIKTQKYAHFQRFRHAMSAVFSQKATNWKDSLDKGLWRHHTDQCCAKCVSREYTDIRCSQTCNGSDAAGLLHNTVAKNHISHLLARHNSPHPHNTTLLHEFDI